MKCIASTRSLFAACALFTCALGAHAEHPHLIDQRNANYQAALEHLARAHQSLAVAKQELASAQASYDPPGLDVDAMRTHITPLEDTLKVLLSPEKKRMAHTTLVPDATFFIPVRTGD